MKRISVVIEGTTPILLHNPLQMGKKKPGKDTIPTPEEEAEAGCYWTDDKKSLAFPADNIKASVIVVAPMYKSGKIRLTPFVCGSLYIEPQMVPFGTKEYSIDTRRAVIQRQGILRSRPRLNTWKLQFDVLLDEDFPGVPLETIKMMFEEAGRRVGIGSFRPQKKGWFGKFKVVQWKETR